jgi:uncharacterized protein (DUF1778 family)
MYIEEHLEAPMSTKTERIDARFDPEIKALAERAALVGNQSLTAYLSYLVRKDAPRRLKKQREIILTNERFDQFVAACEQAPPPSKKLLKAAKTLDKKGF